jgi:hypothetical protein
VEFLTMSNYTQQEALDYLREYAPTLNDDQRTAVASDLRDMITEDGYVTIADAYTVLCSRVRPAPMARYADTLLAGRNRR